MALCLWPPWGWCVTALGFGMWQPTAWCWLGLEEVCGHLPGCGWDPVGRKQCGKKMYENKPHVAKPEQEEMLLTGSALSNQKWSAIDQGTHWDGEHTRMSLHKHINLYKQWGFSHLITWTSNKFLVPFECCSLLLIITFWLTLEIPFNCRMLKNWSDLNQILIKLKRAVLFN